jgi:stage II sporulation protein D
MVEIRLTNDAAADDDEIAACLAAVQCLLDEHNVDKLTSGRKISPWRQAALLEATGRARRISDNAGLLRLRDLWRSANGPKVLTIAFLLAATAGLACGTAPVSARNNAAAPAVIRPPIPQTADSSAALSDSLALQAQPGVNADSSANSPLGSNTDNVPPPDVNETLSNYGRPAPPSLVRVLLSGSRDICQFNLPDGAVLKDVATGDTMAQLPPQSRWQVSLSSSSGYPQIGFSGTIGNARFSRVLIASRNEYRPAAFVTGAVPTAPNMVPIPAGTMPRFWLPAMRATRIAPPTGRSYMLVPNQEDGTIGLGGKLYRGAMVIHPNAGGNFDVVDYVDIEDYLQSVVPSEMPSGWPLEALKSQAIAARSYAVANMGKHESNGYDLRATNEDQVYLGVGGEAMSTNLAIAQTRGVVMRYQGNVITAYFHSASGGWTESAENVWSKPLPFLRAVADYDDQSPYFSWSRSCQTSQIEQNLQRNNRGVGNLLSMLPVSRGESPRVRWLLVTGTARSLYISGEEARKIFNLPSTCFNVAGSGNSYVFAGRGFGHGLGMSQWGAKRLAEVGYSANDILNYYYKDVSIERL